MRQSQFELLVLMCFEDILNLLREYLLRFSGVLWISLQDIVKIVARISWRFVARILRRYFEDFTRVLWRLLCGYLKDLLWGYCEDILKIWEGIVKIVARISWRFVARILSRRLRGYSEICSEISIKIFPRLKIITIVSGWTQCRWELLPPSSGQIDL
jgi:hypothetical protein